MSRKGKTPIQLPKGVELKVENNEVIAKGPKGTLKLALIAGLKIQQESGIVHLSVEDESREMSRLHGLYRSLIQNLVTGTFSGFEEKLEMIGVGYRAAKQGHVLDLQIGKSHPTKMDIPKDINVTVEKNTLITIAGIDKQKVGQFAAEIRAMLPPEPYQGKGIRYQGEYVRKKAGKAAKTAAK